MAQAWHRGLRRLAAAVAGGAIAAARITSAGGADDAVPAADEAHALLDRAYQNLYGHDFVQTLRISARHQGGREITRRLQITRKQTPAPGRALVRFLDPGDIRRTSMLLIEREDRSDEIYLYLPAFGIVNHLAISHRSDAFFGTDITYEDLEPKAARNFEVRALGPGRAGGLPCTRIEIRPRAGTESMYERIVSCVDRERPLLLWSEFHRHGEILKRLEVDPESIRQVGTRLIPFRARFASDRRGTETWIVTEAYEARADIPDAVFTIRNLESGDPAGDRSRSDADP